MVAIAEKKMTRTELGDHFRTSLERHQVLERQALVQDRNPEPSYTQPSNQPSPDPKQAPENETVMQMLDREARERGEAEIKIRVENTREMVRKLELDRNK